MEDLTSIPPLSTLEIIPLAELLNKTIPEVRAYFQRGDRVSQQNFTLHYLRETCLYNYDYLYDTLENHPNKLTVGYFGSVFLTAVKKIQPKDKTLTGLQSYEYYYLTTRARHITIIMEDGHTFDMSIK